MTDVGTHRPAVMPHVEILVWTIAHGDSLARVGEDGRIEGDAELVALLQERFREPVTVYRQGTVAPSSPGPVATIDVRPGESRYVVARIRTLCAGDGEFAIVGCDWR